jgi:hypothetical protein
VAEESSNVSKSVRFVPVDRVIVFSERCFKQVGPEPVDLCKALADKTIELGVRSLLRAAFDNHGRQLGLLSRRQIDLHELVAALFEINAGHDGQVDGSPQIDEIGVRLVFDIHLSIFFVLL